MPTPPPAASPPPAPRSGFTRRPARRAPARAHPAPRPSGRPAAASSTPAERARVRRLVRSGLVAVVAVQAVALVLVLSPGARAQWAVYDAAVHTAVQTGFTTLRGSVTSGFSTANDHLRQVRSNTDRMKALAEQHSRASGRSFSDDLAAVTSTPTGRLTSTAGALSYGDSRAAGELGRLVPGAVPWQSYNRDYSSSANAALLTLRGGMEALHEFNRSIEDASRLNSLASAARSSDSYLALDQLQVESQLEVARQLQALRAQQALSTNLYAVAESHRIGSEARQRAQDNKSGCSILADVLGGLPGAAALSACGGSSPGPGL